MVIQNFLNLNAHQNSISRSKVAAILLKGWIFPIGQVASGRACICSLRSRLVIKELPIYCTRIFTSWDELYVDAPLIQSCL